MQSPMQILVTISSGTFRIVGSNFRTFPLTCVVLKTLWHCQRVIIMTIIIYILKFVAAMFDQHADVIKVNTRYISSSQHP